jgi:ElaB/YqjD/DUF883 family membrane-anchored ribosome-binding protein
MSANAQPSVETLEKEVKDLREDVAALRKALREETARRKAEHASGPFGAAAGKAAENVERLRTAAHDAGASAQDHLEELERRIEENPLPSAGIAFGLGFLIGRIFSR